MTVPPDLPPSPDDDLDDVALPPPEFLPVWSEDLGAAADVRWLWDGYVAPSNITLLTSQWKSGKTTLLAVLLARRAAGGTLAGRALRPGRTAVVCEEHEGHWQQRRRSLDFGPGVAFFCQPYHGRKPTQRQWESLLDSLVWQHVEAGIDLVVIDPLAAFLPGRGENNAEMMLEALLPLERLQSLGVAVVLLHHPRKGATIDGQAARGSGALPGHVDILVEMRHFRAASDDDRRRVLHAYSRYPATPRRLVIEWSADGTDYISRGDLVDEEFREQWLVLLGAFESAPRKLSRRELRTFWPAGREMPSDATLWRWLERAVERGLLLRDGGGHCDSPFRYWLPAREQEWLKDPMYRLRAEDEARRARLAGR